MSAASGTPDGLLRRGLGRHRLLQGRRWWTWFLGFALVACIHDWVVHTPVPIAWAADEATAGGDETTDEGGEEDHGSGHQDPAAPVLLAIVLILFSAKVSGDLFERLGMPAVLGELTVGVLLGNLSLMGIDTLEFLKPPAPDATHADADAPSVEGEPESATSHDDHAEASAFDTGAILTILASLGVILLLFEVGLESSVGEMLTVGVSSLIVAILGVVAPMILGYGVGLWLLPGELVIPGGAIPFEGGLRHAAAVFLGATLCATSVGITARVLKDLGRSQQTESRIILGAAVVDDVLGLIVLAIVQGVILAVGSKSGGEGGHLAWDVSWIVIKAFAFLAGALALGAIRFPRALFKVANHLRGHGLLVTTALLICFAFSWLANFMGLATIVGAFAAGLILENAHYRELGERENHELEEAIAPISGLLVPIFFVQMGLQVKLDSFANPSVWALAAGITIAAIVGKQVCSFGVREDGLNKLAVGLGMIPRGEVGLIFANVGRTISYEGNPIIGDATYSAVIVMVMVTTMVTPPLLKWSLGPGGTGDEPAPDESAGDEH